MLSASSRCFGCCWVGARATAVVVSTRDEKAAFIFDLTSMASVYLRLYYYPNVKWHIWREPSFYLHFGGCTRGFYSPRTCPSGWARKARIVGKHYGCYGETLFVIRPSACWQPEAQISWAICAKALGYNISENRQNILVVLSTFTNCHYLPIFR